MARYKIGDIVWFPIVGMSPPAGAVDYAIVGEIHELGGELYYHVRRENAIPWVWCGGSPEWQEEQLYPDRKAAATAVKDYMRNRIQAWSDALDRFEKEELY